MELHQIQIDRSQLDKVPEEERTLLILLAHAANELNILAKLFHWSGEQLDNSEIERKGNNAIVLLIIRILTGKLYETWKLLGKAFFGTKLSQRYEQEMDAAGKTALRNLKGYFGKKNIIEIVRNRHSFHYAPDQITAFYSALPEDEELELFLGEEGLNTLYYFADVISNRAMLNEIDIDHIAALEKLRIETTQVHGDFVAVLANLMAIAVKRHLGTTLDDLGAQIINLNPSLSSKDISIPFFIRIADEDI